MFFSAMYFCKYYVLAIIHWKFCKTYAWFMFIGQDFSTFGFYILLRFKYNEVLKCWFEIHSSLILFHEYEENIFSSEDLYERTIPHKTFSCLLLLIRNRIFQVRTFHSEKIKSRWPAKIENVFFNFFPKGNMFCGETDSHMNTSLILSGRWHVIKTDSYTITFPSEKCINQMKIFFFFFKARAGLFCSVNVFKGICSHDSHVLFQSRHHSYKMVNFKTTWFVYFWSNMKIFKEDKYPYLNISRSSTKIISLHISLKKTHGSIHPERLLILKSF